MNVISFLNLESLAESRKRIRKVPVSALGPRRQNGGESKSLLKNPDGDYQDGGNTKTAKKTTVTAGSTKAPKKPGRERESLLKNPDGDYQDGDYTGASRSTTAPTKKRKATEASANVPKRQNTGSGSSCNNVRPKSNRSGAGSSSSNRLPGSNRSGAGSRFNNGRPKSSHSSAGYSASNVHAAPSSSNSGAGSSASNGGAGSIANNVHAGPSSNSSNAGSTASNGSTGPSSNNSGAGSSASNGSAGSGANNGGAGSGGNNGGGDEDSDDDFGPINPNDDGMSNRTSFKAGQEGWDADHLPDILYVFERTAEHMSKKPMPTETKIIHGKEILHFEILPDNISSDVEEFRVEAWFRLESRLRLSDVADRMHPRYRITNNTLQMRLVRFRSDFNMLAWGSGNAQTPKTKDLIVKKMQAKKLDLSMNSTRGLTPGLIDPTQGESGERVEIPKGYRGKWSRPPSLKSAKQRERERVAKKKAKATSKSRRKNRPRQPPAAAAGGQGGAGPNNNGGSGAPAPAAASAPAPAPMPAPMPAPVPAPAPAPAPAPSSASEANTNEGTVNPEPQMPALTSSPEPQSPHSDIVGKVAHPEPKVNKRNPNIEVVIPALIQPEPIFNGDDWLEIGLDSEDYTEDDEDMDSGVPSFRQPHMSQEEMDALFAPENMYDQRAHDFAAEVGLDHDMMDAPAIEDPEAEKEAEEIERVLESFVRRQQKKSGPLRNLKNLPYIRSLLAHHI